MGILLTILHMLVFLVGLIIVAGTIYSAVETFVLPRAAPDSLTRLVFRSIRFLFDLRLHRTQSYLERDRIMALYAPVSLLTLLPVWYVMILIAYTLMYWSSGNVSLHEALTLSGSSLLTLGFALPRGYTPTLLAFSEAALGLILVGLLIAYLPSMYSAFSRREAAVSLLEVRAGNPPTALEMILRYHRIHGLNHLTELWITWEGWFVDIEETHTTFPALVFFRSPLPDRSWITAAGAILDAASMVLSTVDIPSDAQAALCIRAGYLSLRRIAGYFGFPFNPNPRPDDPILITRQEYDAVYEGLAANGVPLKQDREQAWRDFNGWRVNYETVLLALVQLTLPPPAPWSSDRPFKIPLPGMFISKK